LRRRPLNGPRRQAVESIVKRRQGEAGGRFAGEEVRGVSEVEEMRQHTNTRRNLTGEQVVGHVELLQADGVSDGLG